MGVVGLWRKKNARGSLAEVAAPVVVVVVVVAVDALVWGSMVARRWSLRSGSSLWVAAESIGL